MSMSPPTPVDPASKSFFYEYGTVRYRPKPNSDPFILGVTVQENNPGYFLRLFSSFVELTLPQPLHPHPKKVWADISKISDFPHFKKLHPNADNIEILKCCSIPTDLLTSTVHKPIETDYIELVLHPPSPAGASPEPNITAIEVETKGAPRVRVRPNLSSTRDCA